MTVRDGRVLGDVSGAGAALGCYWGCCFPVLVMVRAHVDDRVLGRGCRIIMMLAAAS